MESDLAFRRTFSGRSGSSDGSIAAIRRVLAFDNQWENVSSEANSRWYVVATPNKKALASGCDGRNWGIAKSIVSGDGRRAFESKTLSLMFIFVDAGTLISNGCNNGNRDESD